MKKPLGRGLDSLIPRSSEEAQAKHTGVVTSNFFMRPRLVDKLMNRIIYPSLYSHNSIYLNKYVYRGRFWACLIIFVMQ